MSAKHLITKGAFQCKVMCNNAVWSANLPHSLKARTHTASSAQQAKHTYFSKGS